ncbi:hypothetical protein ACTHQF_06645 [Pedobacter sp. SAFR-022]|uniref:hypothetical protein n=1 Tax=Pedobacter sp. SAFR-022 TaxID=3436861 RepID=UPI003F7E5E36
MAIGRDEIIAYIEKTEMLVVVHTYTIQYLTSPYRTQFDLQTFGQVGNLTLYSKSGSRIYPVEKNVKKFLAETNEMVYIMNNTLIHSIVFIGDLIQQANLSNHSPEFEFLRHLRNAMAHGNRFHFKNNEPKRAAFFNEFKLTSELDGMNKVIPDFLGTADVLDLLSFIKSQI